MKLAVTLLSAVVVALFWIRERFEAAALTAEIAALHAQSAGLASLTREQEQFRALQPNAEELAALRRASSEHARASEELAARLTARAPRAPEALTPGEWLPPAAWRNRGAATPTSSVETALWAAAGGDLVTLKNMLHLPPDVRAKADALLARLPESARHTYADAEQLIAAFTAQAIPLGDAQLIWQHQPSPDEAVACVFLKNPAITSTSLPSAPPGRQTTSTARNQPPPMSPSNKQVSSAYLSLRRDEHGWRLVVPPSAIDKIARELGTR